MSTVRLLTNSSLSTFRSCNRKYFLKYVRALRTIGDDFAPRVGTAFHRCREAHDKGEDVGSVLEPLLQDPFDLALVAAMDEGYRARWANEPLEVVATEQVFEIPLRNPDTGAPTPNWKLGGKIDRIVKLPDGRLALQEYKSTSRDFSPGKDYWVRLHLDPQLSLYVVAARALGFDVQTILYDVTRRPGQRPSQVPLVDPDGVKIVHGPDGQRVRTKDGKKWRETGDSAQGFVLQTRPETPEEFAGRVAQAIDADPGHHFARIEIARLEQDLDEALRDVWRTQTVIRGCELEEARLEGMGRKPSSAWAKNPDGCMGNGFTCEFLALCQSGFVGERIPDGFRQADEVHEELAAPDAA